MKSVTHFMKISYESLMKSTMSVVKSSKVVKVNKNLDKSIIIGVSKKKFNIKKNNIICCGNLRGDMTMTMFRGTMCHQRVM